MSRPFLERMSVVQTSAGASLEALFHPPLPGETQAVLLVPGIPGLGGGLDCAILAELSFAFSQRGLGVLRFNFRGVGASTRTEGELTSWLLPPDRNEAEELRTRCAEDVHSALRQLHMSVSAAEIVIVTVGFGACALQEYFLNAPPHDEVASLVENVAFVAAPFGEPHAFANSSRREDISSVDEDTHIFPMLPAGLSLQIFAASEDKCLTDDVIAQAEANHIYPQRIAGADVAFTRGLSELGQLVVARTLPNL